MANTPIAKRYVREQLDPVHLKIAEETEALLKAYPYLTQLPEEVVKKAAVALEKIGKASTKEEKASIWQDFLGTLPQDASALVGSFIKQITPDVLSNTITGIGNVSSAVGGVQQLGTDATNVASASIGVAKALLYEAPLAAIHAFIDRSDPLFSKGVTPEDAVRIATYYASAKQAVNTDSTFMAKGFETLDKGLGWWRWAVETLRNALTSETVRNWGLVGKILVSIGEALPDYKEEQSHDYGDAYKNNLVRKALVEVGVDASIAEGLTKGGTGIRPDGQTTKVIAPSTSSPAPTVPDAPKTPDGKPVVVEPSVPTTAAAIGQALSAAWNAAVDKVKKPLEENNLGAAGQVIAAGTGTAIAGQVLRGTAEGINRQTHIRPDARATSLAAKEAALAKELANLEKAKPGGWGPWRKTAEDIAEKIAEKKAALSRLTDAWAANVSAAEAHAPVSNFAKNAATPLGEINNGSKLRAVLNAPRGLGRIAGDVLGRVGEGTIYYGERLLSNTPRWVLGTGKFVGEKMPLIGGAFTSYEMFWKGYNARLEADHNAKLISDNEYSAISGVQAVYLLSGFGGFITQTVRETAVSALHGIAPETLAKYLPSSVIDAVLGSRPSELQRQKTESLKQYYSGAEVAKILNDAKGNHPVRQKFAAEFTAEYQQKVADMATVLGGQLPEAQYHELGTLAEYIQARMGETMLQFSKGKAAHSPTTIERIDADKKKQVSQVEPAVKGIQLAAVDATRAAHLAGSVVAGTGINVSSVSLGALLSGGTGGALQTHPLIQSDNLHHPALA